MDAAREDTTASVFWQDFWLEMWGTGYSAKTLVWSHGPCKFWCVGATKLNVLILYI